MSLLFDRVATVTLVPRGKPGIRISGLRLEFSIEKDRSTTPNSLELKISNLAENTLTTLEKKTTSVMLEAGYKDNAELLYVGDLTEIEDVREGVDRVTTFKAGDGANSLRDSTLFESFAAGVTLSQVFARIAQSMGVPLGEVRGVSSEQYVSGFSAAGSSRKTLDILARRLKLRWSIQDGQLQVLPAEEPSASEAVRLSPETGLIQQPERTDDGVKFVSLLQPRLQPGRKVVLESRILRGTFLVEKVEHEGDTHGDIWQSSVTARPVRS